MKVSGLISIDYGKIVNVVSFFGVTLANIVQLIIIRSYEVVLEHTAVSVSFRG